MKPSWNQPICWPCWVRREGDRVPVRLRSEYASLERCSFCGKEHRSGIYVRQHPDTVPFPAEEEEDE